MDETATFAQNFSQLYNWQNETNASSVHIGLMCVSGIIFVPLILTNGLLITVVFKNKHLQKPPNIIILNMAIADLLQALFGIPIRELMIYEYDIARDIVLGTVDKKYICILRIFFTLLATGGALFFFVTLAIERFVAIVLPFRYDRWMCKRNTIILTLMSWGLVISIIIPVFFGWNTWDVRDRCSVLNTLHRISNSAILNPLIYGSLSLTTILYGKIFWIAKIKQSQILAQIQAVDHARAVAYKRSFKILKTVVIILGLFILSWIPLLFVRVVLPRTNLDANAIILLTKITFNILLIKSIFNPVIFCEKDRQLRKAVLKLLGLNRDNVEIPFTAYPTRSKRDSHLGLVNKAFTGARGTMREQSDPEVEIGNVSNSNNIMPKAPGFINENSEDHTNTNTIDITMKDTKHPNSLPVETQGTPCIDINLGHI
ncbi:unnamed protein product [Owenia fusiformis]|uniref:Uncharacterized protein n=1 Tax=Owenia fusiformis TaxID=6347 RepID=A0A8J1UAB8_OWEFU|nr:unnamed protein product [Owenia fusiformis]